MQDSNRPRRGMRSGDRASAGRRLEPGKAYFDMNNPERGPFVATGDEQVDPGANFVAEEDFDAASWRSLVSEGWGERTGGSGNRSPDQGAFGNHGGPRSDELNARPPGVGDGFTPKS